MVRSVLRYGFWLSLVGALFVLFAPVQIGGWDTYVITDGTSMLPTIHGGGLVITRRDSSYHVGEVVAYHNAQLDDAVILHRVIAENDGHYTFQGDNNAEADLYPPTKDKLVGREWIYWPSGGRLLMNLRVPWVGALLIGLVTLFAFSGGGVRRRRRRRHHRARTT